jgi:ABC-type glutathione transport system ATPase component
VPRAKLYATRSIGNDADHRFRNGDSLLNERGDQTQASSIGCASSRGVRSRCRRHAGIQLPGVSKTYRSRDGDVPSLQPLDFHINAGEFFVVVGPSGCGKSTLLKMISGLLPPSTGEISVEGEAVTKPHGNVGSCFRIRCCCHGATSSGNVMLPIDMKRCRATNICARDGAVEAGRARRF